MSAVFETTPKGCPGEALDHVLYEMTMMLRAKAATEQADPKTFEHSAFLESFVIHVRALDEFFTKPDKKRRDDDMAPGDFVAGWVEKVGRDSDADRMHKEIAHLTYGRKRKAGDGGWDLYATAWPIVQESIRFLVALKNEGRLVGFGDNFTRVEQLLLQFRGVGLTIALGPSTVGVTSSPAITGWTGSAAPTVPSSFVPNLRAGFHSTALPPSAVSGCLSKTQ
ncbi:MAG TPA: hypothetical protein VGL42_05410 [Opitutaceae bacterium]|jgi:hypothetical protein